MIYTVGSKLNGYTLRREFAMTEGGQCQWTFAYRYGKEYFIKRFLRPIYPLPEAPLSPYDREQAQKQCEAFEARHRRIQKMLSSKSAEGGNLIIAQDFFREHTHYFKVTEKVEVTTLLIDEYAKYPLAQRIMTLKTLANSLAILHEAGLVHGDLKPGNILIKRTPANIYAAKLIDFDDSFFAASPPDPENIVGDFVYYSPELSRYVQKDEETPATALNQKSDIFALGVICFQYLTGELPKFGGDYEYVHEAVNGGAPLYLENNQLPPHLASLVLEMLQQDPAHRPDIGQVFARLTESPPDIDHVIGSTMLKGDLPRRMLGTSHPHVSQLKGTGLK